MADDGALAEGWFGGWGGSYVPETLVAPLQELTEAWQRLREDPQFLAELQEQRRDFIGRPTPIYLAESYRAATGLEVWLKREDLCHTGAHKINNTLGQVLLAQRMGKTRVIAETGAGQHGVATAAAAARLGLRCEVYMGAEDCRRQELNLHRMRLLGAEVVQVELGSRTLKDAMSEAMRDWVANLADTHYVIGSVAGPHPYPQMVREFSAVLGEEARGQFVQRNGGLPDALVACVGGGSNALGLFAPFLGDQGVRVFGVEAAGEGLDGERHAATLTRGRAGVLHGSRSYVLQDDAGQILPTHSISAGLDYPGVGPEHSWLKDQGRASYLAVTDAQVVQAAEFLSRSEGILPALESSHALAALPAIAEQLPKGARVLLCLSGRGDKDLDNLIRYRAEHPAPPAP